MNPTTLIQIIREQTTDVAWAKLEGKQAANFCITDTSIKLTEISTCLTGIPLRVSGQTPYSNTKVRLELGLLIWPESEILQRYLDCLDPDKLKAYIRNTISEKEWAEMSAEQARFFNVEDGFMKFGEISTSSPVRQEKLPEIIQRTVWNSDCRSGKRLLTSRKDWIVQIRRS